MMAAAWLTAAGWAVLGLAPVAQPTIELKTDKPIAQIAEPVELRLQAEVPAGWKFDLPDAIELPVGWELMEVDAPASRAADQGRRRVIRRYVIEAFAPGQYVIDPLAIQVIPESLASGESSITLRTQPLRIQVQSALGLLESATELRSIDGELPLPWTVWQWLFAFSICAAVSAVSVIGMRWLSERLSQSALGARDQIRKLHQVDRQRLRGKLSYDQALLQAADLLRQALQRASGHPNVYRTTAEWGVYCLTQYGQALAQSAGRVLSAADSIKFNLTECSLDEVRKCIKETRDVMLSLEKSARPRAKRKDE